MSDQKVSIKKNKDETSSEGESMKTREIAIRRNNPFSLFQDIDRYFNDLSRNLFDSWFWPIERTRRKPIPFRLYEDTPHFRTPLTNVLESESNFIITAELPGLDKNDIEIFIRDGNLEIKGAMKQKKVEETGDELIRREYRSSSYFRCFKLPDNIDSDKIEANLENGILSVSIPKKVKEKEEIKKVQIS